MAGRVEWRSSCHGGITAAKRRPDCMTRRKRRVGFAAKAFASRLHDVA